jgi:hemerythrin-like metal-binding protein
MSYPSLETSVEVESTSIAAEHLALESQISEVLNMLRVLPVSGLPKNRPSLAEISCLLRSLTAKARAHFDHEEEIMRHKDFAGLRLHQLDHDYLLNSLEKFVALVDAGKVEFAEDFGPNLESWLEFHIKKFDNAYLKWASA